MYLNTYIHKPLTFASKCIFLKFYLLMVVLGLCCCAGFSLVAASRGYSLAVVHVLLIVVASLDGVHKL